MAKFKEAALETVAGKKAEIEAVLDSLVSKYQKQGIGFQLTAKERTQIINNVLTKKKIGVNVKWQLHKTLARKDPALALRIDLHRYKKGGGEIRKIHVKKAEETAKKIGGYKGYAQARKYLQSQGYGIGSRVKKVKKKGVKLEVKKALPEKKNIKTAVEKLKELKKVNLRLLNNCNTLYHQRHKMSAQEIEEMEKKTSKLLKKRNKLMGELGLPAAYFENEYVESYGVVKVGKSPWAQQIKNGSSKNWLGVGSNANYVGLRLNKVINAMEKRLAELEEKAVKKEA
jgi:hypothetical protein